MYLAVIRRDSPRVGLKDGKEREGGMRITEIYFFFSPFGGQSRSNMDGSKALGV